MKFITIIEMLKLASTSHVSQPLGRWNINNYSQSMLKLKYATEDNCGISQTQQNNEFDDDNKYIYMMGYESMHDNSKVL